MPIEKFGVSHGGEEKMREYSLAVGTEGWLKDTSTNRLMPCVNFCATLGWHVRRTHLAACAFAKSRFSRTLTRRHKY